MPTPTPRGGVRHRLETATVSLSIGLGATLSNSNPHHRTHQVLPRMDAHLEPLKHDTTLQVTGEQFESSFWIAKV